MKYTIRTSIILRQNTISVDNFSSINKSMEKISLEKILKTIKAIRVSESISQSEMAKRLGMSTSFYGMLERGNRTLSVEMLIKTAEAFDCDLSDLIMIAETEE